MGLHREGNVDVTLSEDLDLATLLGNARITQLVWSDDCGALPQVLPTSDP